MPGGLSRLVYTLLDQVSLPIAYTGQDDRVNGYSNSGQSGNRARILGNESEEPMNEVITDDIFTGILLVARAYVGLKWCEGECKKDQQKQKDCV